jgi:predicted nucleic acid-binding protein
MIVFLDSGILGLVSSPSNISEARECKQWLYQLLARGAYVVSSDICDYEVRRGLMLASLTQPREQGIGNLEALAEIIDFLPITKQALKKAAKLWAEARSQGIPTADTKNIDADMIICAQCQLFQEEYPGQYVVIATTNVKHLERFAEAENWRNISL